MKYSTRTLSALSFWTLIITTILPALAFGQLSITCPANISQSNDDGLCGAFVNYVPPVGTGTGTNLNTNLTAGLASGDFFPVGVTFIQYTVSNDEGQSASCSFFVTVIDAEAPVISCPPDITVNAASGACSSVVVFPLPTATDNCAVIEVVQIGGLPSGSAFPVGENTVDFESYDSEGNSSFCRFRIFVIDVSAPTITCPANIAVNVTDACSAVVNYTAPVGTDVCTIADTELTSGLGSGSVFPLGTTVESYTVTDIAGNTATCSFNVNVVDVAPPVITCPVDITVSATPGACDAVVNFATPVATDNCPNPIVTQTAGPLSGTAFPAGTSTVTFTATDGSGNMATCSFDVTVTEDVLPTISCPANIAATTDIGSCEAIVNYAAPIGADNCDGVNTTLTAGLGSGAAFPVGTTTETYTVTDASGNTASCSFDITVTDGEAPVIDCIAELNFPTSPGLCEAVVNFAAPDFTDNCPGGSISQTGGPISGSTFPIGTTAVEFTATDAAGNSSTCSFNIVVADEEAPEINCPANISVTTGGLGCVLAVNYPDPAVSDNCPGAFFTQLSGPVSGELLNVGTYTVEFEAEDAAGNTSTCSFTIAVNETNVPVFDCPANAEVPTDPGLCSAVVNFSPPTAIDPCSDVVVSQTGGPASGSAFPIGTTTLEFTAEDEFGNTAICTYGVIVTDQEAPVFDCPSAITAGNAPGACEAVVSFADPTATDNCDGTIAAVQTNGPASGATFPLGATTIEYTATDAAGNVSTCTFDIVVEDTEAPSIACPADIALLIPNGVCDITLTYADPVADDNCPGVSFALVSGPASGDVVETGIYPVEFEATDAAGNTTTCTFTATITEETPPVFTCPGDLTASTDPGSCEAVVTFDAPTATDDCSDVTVTQTAGPVSGSSFPIGSTAVEFTAEDASGNTTICTFNIVVTDQVDPEIICPTDIAVDNDPGLCGATVTYDLPTGTDDCGPVTIQLISGLGSGAFFPVGTQTETYEVMDESGNTATCSFDVVVSDTEAPVLDCSGDILVDNIPDGDCDALVNYPAPTATDNCTSATITLTEGLASGSAFPVGATTVSFEAVDDAGNISTCSFVITVTENVIPEITCPSDIAADNDPGTCGAVVTYTAPIGTDNCGNAVTTLTSGLGSGATFPVGTTTEEYTVTDLSGNTATCSFTVTVTDVEIPILTCPADITVSSDPDQCEAVVNFDPPAVTDNCDDALVPAQTAGPVSGSAFPVGTTTVTFEATDLTGNVSTCSFDVTVTDQVAPEITCPANISAVANDGDCEAVVNYPAPTATDNCSVPMVTLIDGLPSGSVFPIGVTTITFEATDGDGNSATCSFIVTVSEAVPPTIVCPADITTDNDPASCGSIVNYDLPVATDGCGDVTITLIDGLESGNLFPVGTTTVTYEALDLSGNTAQCSFTVTVNDVEAPVFDCPAEIALTTDSGSCEAVYTFDLPTATDNCTAELTVVQTEGPASGASLGLGETTFAFSTSDASGNTATCTYNVLVSDQEAPVFTSCPENETLTADAGTCLALIDFATPIATDNCTVELVQTEGPANGTEVGPGSYNFVFTATDPSGNSTTCSFTADVLDTEPPQLISCPESISTCDAVVIFDAPVALDNCSDVTAVQTTGPVSGSSFPVGITTVGFDLSDAAGNTVVCTFEVEVLQPATRPEVGGDLNICDETEATLNGNTPDFGIGTWTQISGQGNISSPNTPQTLVTNLGVGSNLFVWTIDPGNGCDALSDTALVIVEPNVSVDAGPDQIMLTGGQVAINASATPSGGDALWTPSNSLSCVDCLNPIASPTVTTTYTLTYTSPLGCERTDSVIVRVTREFPNTITPDGDGVNDVWNIPGLDDFPNVEVVIYNRWGNEIFQSTGYNDPWDGTNNGEDLPTGSYYYIIDYKSPGIENVNGTVNIIR